MSPRPIIAERNNHRFDAHDSDWIAHFDGEADSGAYGFGATEEEAKDDLRARWDDCEPDEPFDAASLAAWLVLLGLGIVAWAGIAVLAWRLFHA